MRQCSILLWLLLALLAAPALAHAPKTGSFELTFSQRSPYSKLSLLTHRLKVPLPMTIPPARFQDYDLTKENFLVYVPKAYDPQKPMGLIVLANYKRSDSLPTPILSQLADANMALIVPNEYLGIWWQRAGLDLDAADNMQQLYRIDRRRVYLFGGADWPDADGKSTAVAPRLGLDFPEVFAGTFSVSINAYRPAKASNGGMWQAAMPRPEAIQFTMDKQRPFVWGKQDDGEFWTVTADAYKSDGFRYFKIIPVTVEQFHYPHYTTDWIPEVLQFMDASTADLKLPVEAAVASPSTRP